jgi:hypothetical protein
MITGYNQDVPYKGKTFHVQTEDRGKENPVIETLIYLGGEIVSSFKTSYQKMLERGCSEGEIAALLEKQHRRIVVEVKLGKYAREKEDKPFGEGIISNKSLDEVILDYLTSEAEGEKMKVSIIEQSPMVAGTRAYFKLRTFYDISEVPVENADVNIKLITSDGMNSDILKTKTNHEGICNALFEIPNIKGNGVIVLNVSRDNDRFESKVLVTR